VNSQKVQPIDAQAVGEDITLVKSLVSLSPYDSGAQPVWSALHRIRSS